MNREVQSAAKNILMLHLCDLLCLKSGVVLTSHRKRRKAHSLQLQLKPVDITGSVLVHCFSGWCRQQSPFVNLAGLFWMGLF